MTRLPFFRFLNSLLEICSLFFKFTFFQTSWVILFLLSIISFSFTFNFYIFLACHTSILKVSYESINWKLMASFEAVQTLRAHLTRVMYRLHWNQTYALNISKTIGSFNLLQFFSQFTYDRRDLKYCNKFCFTKLQLRCMARNESDSNIVLFPDSCSNGGKLRTKI